MARELIDLTGRRFGDWIVIARGENAKLGVPRWLCECACGARRLVRGPHLRNGVSRSCGAATSYPEERAIWRGIKSRCFNEKSSSYADYGGRGITVSPAWVNDFPAFLAHIGPRPSAEHTVDRIDVNGHYEAGNVRWATSLEQMNNKRNTSRVTYLGAEMSLGDAVRAAGSVVALQTARVRVALGWPLDQALKSPARRYRTQ